MLAPRKTGWIGFDAGATGVKAAQIVRKSDGYSIRSAAIVPRRERWTLDDVQGAAALPSGDEFAAALSLCDRIAGSDAAAVLPASACEILQTDGEARLRTTPEDLHRAVAGQTHRSLEDCIFDHWPVDREGRRLNVVAAPLPWSDQISGDVASAGRRCRVVDALPWALTRAVGMLEGVDQRQTVAALDWGYLRATITLIRDGSPAFVRTLKNCGCCDAVASVAQGLRISERDAERVLRQHAARSVDASESPAASAVEELLAASQAQIIRELARTIDYWEGATRGQKPAVIYLFGGGGLMANWGKIAAALGIEMRTWELPWEPSPETWAPVPACLLGVAAGLSALAWSSP